MVDKCSSAAPKCRDSAWLFETLDSERRRKWRQDVTKQVFGCLQMPGGPGYYQLPNAQLPGLIVHQIPGWNWLAHKNTLRTHPRLRKRFVYCTKSWKYFVSRLIFVGVMYLYSFVFKSFSYIAFLSTRVELNQYIAMRLPVGLWE